MTTGLDAGCDVATICASVESGSHTPEPKRTGTPPYGMGRRSLWVAGPLSFKGR